MGSENITAFIMAGGQSRRFGEDKTLFPYEGRPMIEHVIRTLQELFAEVTIVGNGTEKYAGFGLPCHEDLIKGLGPLGGIHTALTLCRTPLAFICAADMPRLNPDLIRYLAARAPEYDAVVPCPGGRFEALHAVYSRNCLIPAEKQIALGRRQIISFFGDIKLRRVIDVELEPFGDPGEIFRNINTHADL